MNSPFFDNFHQALGVLLGAKDGRYGGCVNHGRFIPGTMLEDVGFFVQNGLDFGVSAEKMFSPFSCSLRSST